MGENCIPGSGKPWGCVEVVELLDELSNSPELANASPFPVRNSLYTWRPPADVAVELPPDFSLQFDCLTASSGDRQFAPRGGIAAFILPAALGGYAMLANEHDLNAEQRFSYGVTRLLYQKGVGLREHLNRTFARESDFYVPKVGQFAGVDRHALHSDIGLNLAEQGQSWSPRKVIERGREAAAAVGNADPDEATCIRLGLLEAARRNPIDPTSISEAEGLGLVRIALFDLGPVFDTLPDALVERVHERVLAAIERHVDDDTDAFNRWFFGAADDLVHAIAKQKKSGGPVKREAVRQALLELVFRSYCYVGDCVHFQMNAFARALPRAMNLEELATFELLYQKQWYLGGLPLVMLHDRFAFLREAIFDIWANPRDISRVGVLLKLLSYYGDMARQKRVSDRAYKNRSRHRNEKGRVGLGEELDPVRDAAPPPIVGRFQEIANTLREIRGGSCKCGTTRDWRATLVPDEAETGAIVIDDGCGGCGHTERIEIPREEFWKAGQ